MCRLYLDLPHGNTASPEKPTCTPAHAHVTGARANSIVVTSVFSKSSVFGVREPHFSVDGSQFGEEKLRLQIYSIKCGRSLMRDNKQNKEMGLSLKLIVG